MYGLDAFVCAPPFSAILSIFLILACDGIGYGVIKLLALDDLRIPWLRWQSPILGATFLSVIFYPVALAGYANLYVFRVVGAGLIVFSFFHLYRLVLDSNKKKYLSFFVSINKFRLRSPLENMLFFLLFGYALFSLSPITQADSLDYHVGVALHILNTGSMPVAPEWFNSRLAGNGEVLNAIGLALGAEQFGSLLQFMGLLGIAGLLYHCNNKMNLSPYTDAQQKDWCTFIATLAVSAPVLVFLVGGAKPQLLPLAMTTLALSLTVYLSCFHKNNRYQLKVFAVVCILAMVASQAKMVYLLGGGVVGILALILMYKNRLFLQSAIIGTLSVCLIMMPPVIWKGLNFGGGYFDAFLTPFPGTWPGIDQFEGMLRNYRDSNIWFPFSLLIPSGVGTISTIVGFGVFGFLLLKPKRNPTVWAVIIISFIVFVLAALLGPPTSRSYLEPFFWVLFALTLQGPHPLFLRNNLMFKMPVYLQSIMVGCMLFYGIFTSLPGAFSESYRSDVMIKMANGYELMQWVDKVLPEDAILLSSHRSLGLAPREVVSLNWAGYTEQSISAVSKYLERLKKRKVTHLLIYGESPNESKNFKLFVDCFGGEILGPGYAHTATRNPFNVPESYEAWLYSVDHSLLPGCIKF